MLVARLSGIADEMGAVLRRSAFSPNIKERADCSAALFTADGELLAQAEHIPVHLGSMPASVRAGDRRRRRGARRRRPDRAQRPVRRRHAPQRHHDGRAGASSTAELVGWVANRAHHADVGGTAPGSMPPDATGHRRGGPAAPAGAAHAEASGACWCASSRTPEERRGDLDAQRGRERRSGCDRLAAAAPTRRSTRCSTTASGGCGRRSPHLPDGRWTFADVLDSRGPAPGPADADAIDRRDGHASTGDEVTFDFTGTDAQRPGNVNAVEAVTVSAVAFAIRAVARPDHPCATAARSGRCTSSRPPGTVVAAVPPVAVGAGNVEVSQRVADVCLGALAQRRCPTGSAPPSQGTMNNVLLGGPIAAGCTTRPIGGGQGGRPWADGHERRAHRDDQHARTPRSRRSSARCPVRVRALRLRRGSGGAGADAGGDGIERELEVLADATVSLITERRVTPAVGLGGRRARRGGGELAAAGR